MQKYIEKLKLLYLHPNKFFESVKKENKYWEVLKFYVIMSLVSSSIYLISISPSFKSYTGPFEDFLLPSLIIFAIFVAFIFPFISSAIIHLGVLIFGGKQGYFNTFKPVTYGLIVNICYTIVAYTITGIVVWTSSIPEMTVNSSIVSLIRGFIGMVGLIHTFVIYTMGISQFQKMDNLKSFLGIIIVPIMLLIIFVFLMILMLSWVFTK